MLKFKVFFSEKPLPRWPLWFLCLLIVENELSDYICFSVEEAEVSGLGKGQTLQVHLNVKLLAEWPRK
jgi:hypothetical protein